jgi:N-acetylglucosaminyl-diphospho-decaprenol L-rhamnosyltransferase
VVRGLLNAVVVTYKNRKILANCLTTLHGSLGNCGLPYVVTVVDNNSSDGTRELVRKSFPGVNYIENGENLGLARAINIGVRSIPDAPYTLIMNDDVELFPETVGRMLGVMSEHPDAMGVPANLLRSDHSPQRMKLRIYGLDKGKRNRVRYVSFPGTTACLYRTGVLLELGLFDEFFFFYNEDLDFSIRAKRRGVKFIFDPGAKVVHLRSQGRVKGERFVKPHQFATDYYLYWKHYGPLPASLYLLAARVRICAMKRKLSRAGESGKLDLLGKAEERLGWTVGELKKKVPPENHAKR